MKNKIKNIFLELITNREFVKRHKDSIEDQIQYREERLHHHPQNKKEFFKAKEFLKILRHRGAHFTGQESENMLSHILLSSGLILESIIENRLELPGRYFCSFKKKVYDEITLKILPPYKKYQIN